MSMRMDVTIKHPFSMLNAGAHGAGKTVFTLLKCGLIIPKPERIVWCYAKHQPKLYQDLKQIDSLIEYVFGIPIELEFDRQKRNLLILDDMMDEVSDDKRISQLFTRGCHDNLSIIYLTQNLFHKKQRNISLNSDYMIIFKNARDQSQITHLARQIMPSNIKFIMSVCKDATKLAHSFLMLDLKGETDDRYRVRAKYFTT